MRRIYLIRHGESIGNEENRWQGTADYPLSARGVWQAERTADRLRDVGPARVVASPLGRASETARAIARVLNEPVTIDDRLQEYDLGELAGLRLAEIQERYPAVYQAMTQPGQRYVAMPGEEGARPFRARLAAAWADLIAASAVTTIVVTHRAVMMSLLCHLLELPPEHRSPFRFYNGSISLIEVGPRRTRIGWLNDTCHLLDPPPDHQTARPTGERLTTPG